MAHIAFPVPEVLAPYIHCMTSSRPEDAAASQPVLVLPSGGVSLNFDIGGPARFATPSIGNVTLPRGFVAGQTTGPYSYHSSPETVAFRVIFHPTAFSRLTGIEVADVTNGFIALSHLGPEWVKLDQLIHDQQTDEARVEIITHFFTEKIPYSHDPKPLAEQTLDWVANCYSFSMQELEAELTYADRHIRRVFKQVVGVAPKPYHQIIRFHRTARLLKESPTVSVQDIVAICNYSDSAHLSRQFQAYSGLTLSQYRETSPGPNKDWMIWH